MIVAKVRKCISFPNMEHSTPMVSMSDFFTFSSQKKHYFIILPSFCIPHYFLSTHYFSPFLLSSFTYNLSCAFPFHCFVFVLTTFILLVQFCHVTHFFSFTIKAHVFLYSMLLISWQRAFTWNVKKLIFYLLDSV